MKTISKYRSGAGKGWGKSKGFDLPLSKAQKQTVVIKAKLAFDRQAKSGLVADGLTFEAWRAEVSVEVCGRRISEAVRRDFEGLMSRFCLLANDTQGAFHFAGKDSDDLRERQQVLAVLFGVLADLPVPAGADAATAQRAYANKICRDQFKTGLEGATLAQLQGLVMTCRTRMREAATVAAAVQAASEDDDTIPY